MYLGINNSWRETTTVELPREAEIYALTGTSGMRSRTMCLNGKELVLGENDTLPELIGARVSGKVEIAPGTVIEISRASVQCVVGEEGNTK